MTQFEWFLIWPQSASEEWYETAFLQIHTIVVQYWDDDGFVGPDALTTVLRITNHVLALVDMRSLALDGARLAPFLDIADYFMMKRISQTIGYVDQRQRLWWLLQHIILVSSVESVKGSIILCVYECYTFKINVELRAFLKNTLRCLWSTPSPTIREATILCQRKLMLLWFREFRKYACTVTLFKAHIIHSCQLIAICKNNNSLSFYPVVSRHT